MGMQKLDHFIRELNHKRIDALRAFRMQFLKSFLDQKTSISSHFNKPELPSFLILRLDGKLGDSITSTYLIEMLKAQYPGCQISVVADPSSKILFKPIVSQFWGFKGKLWPALKWLIATRENFDVLICTSQMLTPSTVFLCRFLSSPFKFSFVNSDWQLFSHHVNYDPMRDHVTERYEKTLQMIEQIFPIPEERKQRLKEKSKSYKLDHLLLNAKSAQSFVQRIKSQGIQKICVLNAFAGAKLRNFSEQTNYQLVHKILEDYPHVAVVSIANRGDREILRAWSRTQHLDRRFLELRKRWFISDFNSLEDSVALIKAADLVITPDTSVVHMACAVGTPQVAIFREDIGPEKNQNIWTPIGENFKIVIAKWRGKNLESDGDINHVNVAEILEASHRFLKA